jgi:predicted ferric reductase
MRNRPAEGERMITWNILRAAGVGSYLTLFASVALGLAGTSSLGVRRGAKKSTVSIHQFLSTVGLLLLAIHLGGLLLDAYTEFDLADLFFLLESPYKPVAVAFGIVAMYAMVVVVVASWARKGISTRMWRASHILAIPTFTLAMLHGVFAGTDTPRTGFWLMYLLTGGTVVFLTIFRGLTAREPRKRAKATTQGDMTPRGTIDSGVEKAPALGGRSVKTLAAVPGPPGDRARSIFRTPA